MTTPRIEEILKKYDVRYFDGSTYAVSEEFEKDLVQLEAQAHQVGYADGYKQGKFDAEVTAEYGEPEALQDNK